MAFPHILHSAARERSAAGSLAVQSRKAVLSVEELSALPPPSLPNSSDGSGSCAGAHQAIAAETCPICLDCIGSSSQVRFLPCTHYYHASCVDPWLTGGSATCPLCKASV
ncbi:hypothetical protein GQ54DRAFT_260593 [Martensiomyces pterosporus]|nr:hypothetical protein GQ54DRAFT_260593 [Martensiomyces pterosporus]